VSQHVKESGDRVIEVVMLIQEKLTEEMEEETTVAGLKEKRK